MQQLQSDIVDRSFLFEWKDIPGYPGFLVNRIGSIKNKKTGRVLKSRLNHDGYNVVSVRINNSTPTIRCNRAVALAFIDNPQNKPEVNHIDGDRMNDLYSNLEWAYHDHNIKHSYKYLHRTMSRDSHKPVGRYSFSGELLEEFPSVNRVSREGYSPSDVTRVCVGTQTTYRGYIWKYLT